MAGKLQIKRAYEAAQRDDGVRFLVDRLWPRGIKKERLKIKAWLKDVAPSAELRRSFHHDPKQWPVFQRRYFRELQQHPEAWQPIQAELKRHNVTLVYGARDEKHNNALALKRFLEQ